MRCSMIKRKLTENWAPESPAPYRTCLWRGRDDVRCVTTFRRPAPPAIWCRRALRKTNKYTKLENDCKAHRNADSGGNVGTEWKNVAKYAAAFSLPEIRCGKTLCGTKERDRVHSSHDDRFAHHIGQFGGSARHRF